jgi:AP-1 complex subunit gamma-1
MSGMNAMAPSTMQNNANPFAGLGNSFSGLGSTPTSPPSMPSMQTSISPMQNISPTSTSSFASVSAMTQLSPNSGDTIVYQKNGLVITFRPSPEMSPEPQGSVCSIATLFRNTGNVAVSELNFQVAVPKSLKLQLYPPSGTTVMPNGSQTQSVKIMNPIGQTMEGKAVPIRLRLKIAYAVGANRVDEVVEFGGFTPSWAW